jgi:large repetitive protein
VQVSDLLPANLTLVSAAASVGTCGAGNPVVCDLGALLSGATASVNIMVNVDPLARGTLDNTASVTAASVDLIPGNNSATKSLNLSEAVDLNVTIAASLNPATANHLLRYTLDVSNLGVSTAQNVTAEVHLPAGAVFVGAIGAPDWVCNQAGGVVTCTSSQLATGSAQPILIDILAPLNGSSFTANAAVAFSGIDLDSANNSINLLTSLIRNYFIPIIQNH